jgi:transposase InsO family protein
MRGKEGTPSPRRRRDAELIPVVHEVFWHHRRRYGSRRGAATLADRGWTCGRHRVARPTDRGGEYAGTAYRVVLRRAGMRQSMSRAGNCYDNAFMESCFGTLKTELPMTEYDYQHEVRAALAAYIGYYQTERKPSALGYRSPNNMNDDRAPRP